jgi:hypothetical protein
MRDRPVILRFPRPEADEIADIVFGLRRMAERATSPVVRACLEDAAEDIVHLMGGEKTGEEAEGQQATG